MTEGSYHSSLYFHAFPEGLEKVAINRKKNLPSRKEGREILFPFRRDQEIGSSRKKWDVSIYLSLGSEGEWERV